MDKSIIVRAPMRARISSAWEPRRSLRVPALRPLSKKRLPFRSGAAIVISSEALDASLNSRNTRTYFSAESRTARALEIARLSLMLASLISRDVWLETWT